MDSQSNILPAGSAPQTAGSFSMIEPRNGASHFSGRSSTCSAEPSLEASPLSSHRPLFDRIAPGLRARGIDLDYAEIDVPSFEIGTRRFDENGDLLPVPLPMSLADALHPREGDELVATPLHFFFVALLFELARLRFGGDPSFLWLTDTEFDLKSIDHGVIRPDIALLLNVVNQRNLNLERFYLDKEPEDHPPRFILAVEVTSRSTRQNDFIDKLVMYGDAGFEQYLVIDIHEGRIEIIDFRPAVSYKPLARQADGRVLIESFNVWVETAGQNLVFTDVETGEQLADYPQAIQQIEEMTRQRDLARRIAKNAKRQVKIALRKIKNAEQAQRDAEQGKLAAEQATLAAEQATLAAKLAAARQSQEFRDILKLLSEEGRVSDLPPETTQRLREIMKEESC